MHFLCLQFIQHTLIARLIFFKALLSSFYPLAQAFLRVLSIPSDIKFLRLTAEVLWNWALPPSKTFLTILQQKPLPQEGQFFLWCPLEPVLHSLSPTSVVWSLLPSHSRFITECVGDGMACWQRARTSGPDTRWPEEDPRNTMGPVMPGKLTSPGGMRSGKGGRREETEAKGFNQC